MTSSSRCNFLSVIRPSAQKVPPIPKQPAIGATEQRSRWQEPERARARAVEQASEKENARADEVERPAKHTPLLLTPPPSTFGRSGVIVATPKGRKHFGLARPVQLGPPRSNPPSYAARALASMVGWAAKLTSAAKSRSHGKLHNNDEPTPRFAPDNDDERRSLREEAARGAGTPGYLTKQPQGRTVTGDQRHHSSDRLDSGSTSKSAGGSSSSSSAGPSSPASPERTGGGGRQMPADEAADSFSPSRGELDEASKPADISDNGQQPSSPGGRPLSPHSGRSSPGRHSPQAERS